MAMHSHVLMNPTYADPVTKAVVDNIMGNVPAKRPLVRCEDCDLCFTSQTVLDAHLQGARHAKQIRSKVIMATLEETKVAFSKDQEANGLMCNICNVCLNSIQQFQTHLNGNRHKKKAVKGGSSSVEVSSESVPVVTSTFTTPAGSFITPYTTPVPAPPPPPAPARPAPLSCQMCNKFFNSKGQYDVHVASRKHIARSIGGAGKNKKRRYTPFVKKKKEEMFTSNRIDLIPSLSTNFISGGFTNA